jgi:ribosomal protein S18 acetylase RimI-like enzyme
MASKALRTSHRRGSHYDSTFTADGVWNLYFIGVQPEHRGKGLGTRLIQHVEGELRALESVMLLVETSGSDSFERTQAFYRKHQYAEALRVPDFYSPGEDKVTFCKVLKA